jgi:hypothetical protein
MFVSLVSQVETTGRITGLGELFCELCTTRLASSFTVSRQVGIAGIVDPLIL